jgi:dimethylhistidine N-methyltransferase
MSGRAVAAVTVSELAAEVRASLTKEPQKELPSKYLYDDVGTALFEVITLLPEYGLSRAGERLLQRSAPELAERLREPVVVAELGSGSGKKTRFILEAFAHRQTIRYYPIDISATALDRCRQELAALNAVEVEGIEKAFLPGLEEVAARRPTDARLLLLFLGSTIGNFDRPVAQRFLRQLRRCLRPGDSLLLGTDLEKPVPQLLLAYDDPLGVTAAFNLNLLARINRELGANFVLPRFQHLALYNEDERRIEMHLRSRVEQVVTVPTADLVVRLGQGETIWTESSHKFNTAEVVRMGEAAGFGCQAQWVDAEWPFAQTLLVAR